MVLQKFIFRSHLDDDEELLFVAHRHWMEILVPVLKLIFFGVVFPWMIWYFVIAFSIWFIVLWHLIFIGWFVYQIADWYLDALLVTSAGVIDVAWHGILYRTSSRVDYADLKDISYEIQGIWSTLLNFGLIKINLISGGEVNLENVNNPKYVESTIQDYKQKFLEERKVVDAATIQEILSEIVQHHIEEHGVPEKKVAKKKQRKKLGRKEF